MTGAPDVVTFKQAMARFATGVAIVTAMDEGEPVGFTCQSVVSLSLDPMFVALAPAKTSTSWPRIAAAGHFCVNVLGAGQEEVARAFAVSGGDKFDGVAWSTSEAGAPALDGSIAYVECHLELVHDAGDHEIVIGRVVGVRVSQGGAGTPDPADRGPLVFYESSYRRLEQH